MPAIRNTDDRISFCDFTGKASVHNLTIAPNGNKIMGDDAGLVISTDRASGKLIGTNATVKTKLTLSIDGVNEHSAFYQEAVSSGATSLQRFAYGILRLKSDLMYYHTQDSGGTGLVYISVSGFTLDL